MIVCPTWASHWWGRQENRNWSAKNSAIAMAPNIKKNGCHQFAEPVGLRCIMHQKPLAVNWRRSQICVVLRPPPPTPPTPHPRPQLLRLHWAFLLHPTLLHAASVAPATVYGPQMMCRNVAVKRMRTATKYYPIPTPHPPSKSRSRFYGLCCHPWRQCVNGKVWNTQTKTETQMDRHSGGHNNRSINWLMACWMYDLMDGFVHVNQWKSFSSSTLRVRVSGNFPTNRVVGIFWKLRIVLIMNIYMLLYEQKTQKSARKRGWTGNQWQKLKKKRQQNRTKTIKTRNTQTKSKKKKKKKKKERKKKKKGGGGCLFFALTMWRCSSISINATCIKRRGEKTQAVLRRKILHVFSAKGTDSHREAFPFMFRASSDLLFVTGIFLRWKPITFWAALLCRWIWWYIRHFNRQFLPVEASSCARDPLLLKTFINIAWVIILSCNLFVRGGWQTHSHACMRIRNPPPPPPRSTYPPPPLHTLGTCLLFRYANVSVSSCVQAKSMNYTSPFIVINHILTGKYPRKTSTFFLSFSSFVDPLSFMDICQSMHN